MSRIIRCKLRCMSIDLRREETVLTFYAVTDDGEEENKLFWQYTPAAQLTMTYPPGEHPELFQPNSTYFFDMEVLEDACDWAEPDHWMQTYPITLNSPESREYTFLRHASAWGAKKNGDAPPYKGEFKITVDNVRAYEVLDLDGMSRTWRFSFSKAPEFTAFYVNDEHHYMQANQVTYAKLLELAGVLGPAVVTVQSHTRTGPWVQVAEDSFELSEFSFYKVEPLG